MRQPPDENHRDKAGDAPPRLPHAYPSVVTFDEVLATPGSRQRSSPHVADSSRAADEETTTGDDESPSPAVEEG